MMQALDRFTTSPRYRQALIQVGCPVYVHCSRVCTDRRTGDRFLQLRLVNRWDREIETVILSIDSYDAWGNPCGKLTELILPSCKAQPHSIFGEDRLLALGKLRGAKMEVTITCVGFTDGMIWRTRAINSPCPLEESGWTICTCGLPNEPEQECCDLCGRTLRQPVSTGLSAEMPVEVAEEPAVPMPVQEPPLFKPEPILRTPEELQESCNAFVLAAQEYEDMEEEEDEGVPRWLFILLCVIGGVALLAALTFLFYFLRSAQLL